MTTIRLGSAAISRDDEMRIPFPAELLASDPSVLATHEHWLAPRYYDPVARTCNLNFHSWLLQVDGRNIVIDPCSGNDRNRPVFPFFDHLDTPFLERFEATGVLPDDVDFVFCTHLHNDHCGWNTHLRDGCWVPTFPKARYLFVRREYERWDSRRPRHRVVDCNVGVFDDSVLPVVEAGLFDLVEDRHIVTPGLRIEAAHGHALGHSMLHLDCQDARAYFVGDVLHNPLQVVEPRLDLPGADDVAMTIETRLRVLAACADGNALLIPAHFDAPHAGWVSRTDNGFRFEPFGS